MVNSTTGDRRQVLVQLSSTELAIWVMVEAATENMAEYWTENCKSFRHIWLHEAFLTVDG